MGEGTEKPERGRLESGVLRAGIVAGAIAGIVGAVTAVVGLLPDEPAKRSAVFDNVRVVPRVPLSEYNIRSGAGGDGRSASAAGGTVTLRLVAQETGAQQPEPAAPQPDPSEDGYDRSEPAPRDPGEADPPPDEPDPGPEPEPGSKPDPGSEDDGGESGGGSGSDTPPDNDVTPQQAKHKVQQVVPPNVATVAPDGTMEFEDEQTERAVQGVLGPPPELGDTGSRDRPITAEEVVAVFKATRSIPTGDGGTEPVGVLVDFEVGAVGFEGDRLDVRWTLYGARTRRRVPREWLDNRRALLLEPDVEDERGSASMWVPLPKARGPWFVRLSLFDSRGKRLTYVDTRRFG